MASEILDVGTQLQLFLDDWLIESIRGLELKLHSPRWGEVVLVKDKSWEDDYLYDPVVVKEGSRYRMWYRANFGKPPYYTGYMESNDGIHWTKPALSLIEFQGSRDNNLVWSSGADQSKPWVLSVFRDGNPQAKAGEQYKAIGIGRGGLMGLVSPDGLRWQLLQPEPVIRTGETDSHNIALWDAARSEYVAYMRGWRNGIRLIRRAVSADFRHWTEPQYIDLGNSPLEHLYKNAATPYYRSPDILLMFPKRFMEHRKSDPTYPHPGLSDIVFMFSRDGIHWDRRYLEAFIRPGPDQTNWHQRAIEVGPTLVPTGEGEMSLYMVEHYYTPSVRIRRMVLREDGFVSVHASYEGGEFVTKPFTFKGAKLQINYATSAAGSVRVAFLDQTGTEIPGFSLADCTEIYGDEIERTVAWKGGADVTRLEGQIGRTRFVMKDADLYSLRFSP